MNLNQQSNLEGKHDVFFPQPHTFNVSKKLTADSMMIYSVDGKNIFKKVSHLISRDPLYVWNKLYGVGNKFSLTKCAHSKLMRIMQQAHPHLYRAKERRKLLHNS
jgi:hypothetical protein